MRFLPFVFAVLFVCSIMLLKCIMETLSNCADMLVGSMIHCNETVERCEVQLPFSSDSSLNELIYNYYSVIVSGSVTHLH